MGGERWRRPRALRRGDRVAIVAPASGCAHESVYKGVEELERWGLEVVVDERVFATRHYLAGDAGLRAAHFIAAWTDPGIAGLVCTRGGYGSVQILPLIEHADLAATPRVFVGYSDITSLLVWLGQAGRMVTFHGPMLDARLGGDDGRYDRESFERALMSTDPMGALQPDGLETLQAGEASGVLVGGTLTQLVASLGTPYAFDPPAGHVLFIDEVNERPYRLDRMITQLRLAGLLARASAIVFNELPGCVEPNGSVTARDAVQDALSGFHGPVLFGFPSGHTPGALITLPFGVRATVLGHQNPALVIEEAAVS
jgi:muramoyltetrapeptide carboxypeptidase